MITFRENAFDVVIAFICPYQNFDFTDWRKVGARICLLLRTVDSNNNSKTQVKLLISSSIWINIVSFLTAKWLVTETSVLFCWKSIRTVQYVHCTLMLGRKLSKDDNCFSHYLLSLYTYSDLSLSSKLLKLDFFPFPSPKQFLYRFLTC